MSPRNSEPGASTPENNPVVRFFDNPKGFRAAVNAMCATCCGCTCEKQGASFKNYMEPGFRTTIKTCGILSCPLHSLRPYQERASA